MSLADKLISLLRCPGCSSQEWDLRADGADELPRLEGTLCCSNCGQAFAARGGVLDMVPGIVEDKISAFRRRVESPTAARFYEGKVRHFLTPMTSTIRAADRTGYLRRHAPRSPVKNVVDFGCGQGGDLAVMQEECEPDLAVGIDLSPVLLAEAAREARVAERHNVAYVRASLEELPFAKESFTWASCYGVLHRLQRPANALASMAALLEPEGTFTCLTTLELPPGSRRMGQQLLGTMGRVHFFNDEDLADMFRQTSLEVSDLRSYGPVALLAARRDIEAVP